jgi:hypothetical protein
VPRSVISTLLSPYDLTLDVSDVKVSFLILMERLKPYPTIHSWHFFIDSSRGDCLSQNPPGELNRYSSDFSGGASRNSDGGQKPQSEERDLMKISKGPVWHALFMRRANPFIPNSWGCPRGACTDYSKSRVSRLQFVCTIARQFMPNNQTLFYDWVTARVHRLTSYLRKFVPRSSYYARKRVSPLSVTAK